MARIRVREAPVSDITPMMGYPEGVRGFLRCPKGSKYFREELVTTDFLHILPSSLLGEPSRNKLVIIQFYDSFLGITS